MIDMMENYEGFIYFISLIIMYLSFRLVNYDKKFEVLAINTIASLFFLIAITCIHNGIVKGF